MRHFMAPAQRAMRGYGIKGVSSSAFRDARRGHATVCALIIAFGPGLCMQRADAQQIIANGTTETATGTYNTAGPASGEGGSALFSLNGGVIGSTAPLTINAVGPGSAAFVGPYAAFSQSASRITIANGSTVTAFDTVGLFADAGGTITANNTDITLSGTAAGLGVGVFAAGGHVVLNGGSIRTSAGSALGTSYGLYSLAPDSLIEANNIEIEIHGDGGVTQFGVASDFGGHVVLNGGSVRFTGGGGWAVYVDNESTLSASGTTIITEGARATGVEAQRGARIVLDQSRVTTHGAEALGLNTGGSETSPSGTPPATITANGTFVETFGEAAHGARLTPDTLLVATDSTITTHAAGAAGLYAQSSGEPAVARLTGSRVAAEQGDAIRVSLATLDLTAERSSLSGTGSLFNIEDGNSRLNLIADASVLTGAALTHEDGFSSVVLGNASTWNMTGNSVVSQLTNDRSLVAFAAPAGATGHKTLTVRGDYVGNDGTLLMNTELNGDDSATDKLVVGGNTSGNTFIQVANVGGDGVATNAGIQLVNVAGRSDGIFQLQGRAVAGPYEYLLHRGSVSNPADGNWYLRSALVEAELPPEPPSPPAPPPPPPPPAPGPSPELRPVMRPEAGAYLANQSAAAGMFTLTLHDRLGEPGFAESGRAANEKPTAAWARVQGRRTTNDDSMGQLDARTNIWLLQGGLELGRWTQGDSRFHTGLMFGTGTARSDVDSSLTGYEASGRVDGNSVGVYGTWFADAAKPTGLYVDTWLQYGRYDNRVEGQALERETYKSDTLSVSVESGYAFELNNNGNYAVYLEPQAQAIYTRYSADRHVEANGTVVRAEEAGGLLTRLGARLYGHKVGAGNKVQPFLEANWWHGNRNNSVSMDDKRVTQNLPRNTFELKAGAQAELGKGWTAWGQAGVQLSSDYQSVAGLVGVKYAW